MSASPRLPLELMEQILDGVVVETPSTAFDLCLLSSFFQDRYESFIYRHIILVSSSRRGIQIRTLRRSLESHPVRASHVRHLSLLHHDLGRPEAQCTGRFGAKDDEDVDATASDADRILRLTAPFLTHAQLSQRCFYNPCPALYQTSHLQQIHLHAVRDDTAIQALVKKEEALLRKMASESNVPDEGQRSSRSIETLRVAYGHLLPMRRLELCFYAGHVLSSLVSLRGLTHIVLTRIYLPNNPVPGIPTVRLIARSTLRMLLTSPHVQSIVIQDEAPVLKRIMGELEILSPDGRGGTDDSRLIFRVLTPFDAEMEQPAGAERLRVDLSKSIPAEMGENMFVDWLGRARAWSVLDHAHRVFQNDHHHQHASRRNDESIDDQDDLQPLQRLAATVPLPDQGLIVGHPQSPFFNLDGDMQGVTSSNWVNVTIIARQIQSASRRADLNPPAQQQMITW